MSENFCDGATNDTLWLNGLVMRVTVVHVVHNQRTTSDRAGEYAGCAAVCVADVRHDSVKDDGRVIVVGDRGSRVGREANAVCGDNCNNDKTVVLTLRCNICLTPTSGITTEPTNS